MTNGLPEGAEDVPGDLAAQYYAQRASAGLIISEAAQISAQGKGYPATPVFILTLRLPDGRK